MTKVAISTSILNGILMAIILKGLHLFDIIKWHPTKFLTYSNVTDGLSGFEKWLILGILITIITFALFYVCKLIPYKNTALISFIVSLILAVIVSWIIQDLPIEVKSLKKLSIPFIVVFMISFRFISDTASFHATEKKLSHSK